MAKREMAAGGPLAAGDESLQGGPARRPKVVIAAGRGKTGKSVFLSWLAETSLRRYPMRIIDADTNNPVLSSRFPDAVVPDGVDDDRRAWLEAQFDRCIQRAGTELQEDILLDVGGGDLLLKRWGAEMQLADVLDQEGVDPVLVHMLGPDPADLAHLADIESARLFCPKATILVLNSGLVPQTRSARAAFEAVTSSKTFQAVLSPERGGRMVVMPSLPCMRDIEEHGLRFQDAMTDEGRKKIGPLNVVRVRRWLTIDMPAMRSSIADWLPE